MTTNSMALRFSKYVSLFKVAALAKYATVLIAFWGAYWSAQFFLASNAYYSVKNNVEQWQREPSRVSVEKANAALTQINLSISYFPENSLYFQMRGQVYEWLAYTGSDNSNLYLKDAISSYQKSILLRPYWAASWVGLASSKWKLNEVDDEFYHYLATAQLVGPQDAVLHSFISEFGLSMFEARSIHYVNVKDILTKHLDLGLQNPLSRKRIAQSITDKSLEQTVCRWLKSSQYSVRKQIPGCITYD